MNNIIPFPTERRQEQIDDERDREFENFTEECHETAQFILLLIEDYISEDELSIFEVMDFRDPKLAESRDMFVIINLLSSMFMRYGSIKHFLQDDLDAIFDKIEANNYDIN
jgi:hypothetical protein